MAALREIFASFGVTFDSRALQRGAASVSAMTQRVMGLGSVLMGGWMARGLVRFVTSSADMARTVGRSARQLGMSNQEFQGWSFAAGQAGVATERFTLGARLMMRNVAMAGRNAGPAENALRRFGITVRNQDGTLKDTSQMLEEVSRAAGTLGTTAERTDLAMQLFGRSGADLVPLLGRGEDSIVAMRAQFDSLGGGFSDEFIAQSSEFARTQRQWQVAMMGVRSTMATLFLPTFTLVIEAVTGFVRTIRETPAYLDSLKTAVQGIGVVVGLVTAGMAVQWLAATWPILAIVGVIAILGLAVDDLWTTWQGGDSVLRQFIDTLFPGVVDGLDSTDRAILQATDRVYNLAQAFLGLYEIISGMIGLLSAPLQAFLDTVAAVKSIARGGPIGENVSFAWGGLSSAVNRGVSSIARGGQHVSELGQVGRTRRLGVEAMRPERLRGGGHATVNAPVDARAFFNVTVNGATDVDEVDRRVRSVMTEENDRQVRRIRAATVYDYGRG
jgi:hypothetical protein